MDIIHLLPDAIANQIAAGEVVQRPASVVKELMENSLDAGATEVKLIVEEAGKKSLQIIDNGSGMSETDVRMAFERHATSKINRIDDLHSIKTFGFRGEALASISAVSSVETLTKRAKDELGSKVIIEGSELKMHEPCAGNNGTSIKVKNLFYNTPARKNFLKSDQVEFKHIMDEFLRVALAHPDKKFFLQNKKEIVYHLLPGTLRQRAVNIFGKKFDQALVPIQESTPLVEISGFIGKPEFSRKTRGEQFFFVNGRFIKSPYLNHAVGKAFEGLLQDSHHPIYFIYMDLDPYRIDVNVHPTKTEIKFDDEKAIYAILLASIKKALSQHHIAPSLEFDREEITSAPRESRDKINLNFTPPKSSTTTFYPGKKSSGNDDWKELLEVLSIKQEEEEKGIGNNEVDSQLSVEDEKHPFQLQNKFIISTIRSGLMIIKQGHARQRILYEKYLAALNDNASGSQRQLFPEVLELSIQDYKLVEELNPSLKAIGFELEPFGKSAFIMNGIPADIPSDQAVDIFENMLEDHKNLVKRNDIEKNESLARSLAKNMALNKEQALSKEEMEHLIDKLFACEMPYYTPDGKPIFITISLEELDKKFK